MEERNNRQVVKDHQKGLCFCIDRADVIDYKDITKQEILTDRAKFYLKGIGTCAYHQRAYNLIKSRHVHVPYVN